jgi:hypothetical protein
MKRFTRDETEHGQEYYLASDVDKVWEQPVQEPVAWMTPNGEGFRIRFSPPTNDVPLGWDALYTTPPQRTWVGLTEAQFLEATRLAENGNYLVAFVRIQEWLKEKNT